MYITSIFTTKKKKKRIKKIVNARDKHHSYPCITNIIYLLLKIIIPPLPRPSWVQMEPITNSSFDAL